MNNDLNCGNRRHTHMTLAIFAAVLAGRDNRAFATTIHRVDTRLTSSDVPPGNDRAGSSTSPARQESGEAVK